MKFENATSVIQCGSHPFDKNRQIQSSMQFSIQNVFIFWFKTNEKSITCYSTVNSLQIYALVKVLFSKRVKCV